MEMCCVVCAPGYKNNTGGKEPLATPAVFEGVDAVMGHPIPHYVWDVLEAYPNAKVILTVRDADAFVASVLTNSPVFGTVRVCFSQAGLLVLFCVQQASWS